jgi:plasmid stabilization system protein ParE
MVKKVKVTKECERMVEKAAKYIKKNSIEQAEMLFSEFDRHISLIERMPGIGTKYKNGMRKIKLGKFRYNIYYREKEKYTSIRGIWHTSRGTDFEEKST